MSRICYEIKKIRTIKIGYLEPLKKMTDQMI